MNVSKQLFFWSGVSVLLILSLWILEPVLLPFILGAAIAYLLDPLVEKLDENGINRTLSTIAILGLAFTIIAVIAALIVPVLYKELQLLIQNFPGYIGKLQELIAPYITFAKTKLGLETDQDLLSLLYAQKETALNASNGLLKGLAAGGSSVLAALSILALTPLSAFFFIREWPKIMTFLEGLLPRQHEKTIKELLSKMHQAVSGFIRGQLIVACILGLFYALALKLAGLQYGIVIGLSAGLLSLIPMLGAICGLIAAVLTAWLTTFEVGYTGLIAGIFIFGQILEGNFLTPKLVGDQVGLHPLWVIFAVMAGGSLMGIAGMFLAVPVAAIIGVLIGFFIIQYKETAFYTGSVKRKVTAKTAKTKKAKTSSK